MFYRQQVPGHVYVVARNTCELTYQGVGRTVHLRMLPEECVPIIASVHWNRTLRAYVINYTSSKTVQATR